MHFEYTEFLIMQIAQLGQVLLNFTSVVPAGMIVFFPSYKFLNTAKDMWVKTGTLDKLGLKKLVCENLQTWESTCTN